ncbi:MAG TPA: HupE/UreJ family protein, partial [Myxococcaceae bacterium]|nr:HupE/UreJ family protein [Myxococcaceae bacterium]
VQRTARAGAPVLEVQTQPGAWAGAGRFLRLGAEHIFQGADHIAFLLGVLLLGGTFRQLVGIVTAFTVAHSVTLALATLGWVVPPQRLIEPLIALSIVAVAVENLLALREPLSTERVRRTIGHRWRLTFGFGLVHGFGFAGALRALELPRALLAPSLLTFNLGVELGQLVIVALAWPLLRWLRGVGRMWPTGVRWASAGVAVLGVYWLVQRVATVR